MSFMHVSQMSKSEGLKDRLIGAAAQKGRADAELWVTQNIWSIIKATEWEDAWAFAEDNKTPNVNRDTGEREDVITDTMIETVVQALIDEQSTPNP